jgi:histidine triad (HIT) family protein
MLGYSYMTENVFSKIIKGELPSFKIYEDEDTYAFLDIYPTHAGHTLVIPKSPYENIYDMPVDLFQKMMATVHKLAPAVKMATGADGVNIIMNNESAAGQIVFHAHVHIVPRHKGDGLYQWPSKEYKEGEATKIAEMIRKNIV